MEKRLIMSNLAKLENELTEALQQVRYSGGTDRVNIVLKDWIEREELHYTIELPPVPVTLHPTEEKFPEMTARFQEITAEMYKVFLEKNNDYSKWNILGTGIVGLATRFWDKTSRIMNLVGFNIGTGEYTAPKKNMVEDEDIEKTFLDASNYGIIARIYLEGKWGK